MNSETLEQKAKAPYSKALVSDTSSLRSDAKTTSKIWELYGGNPPFAPIDKIVMISSKRLDLSYLAPYKTPKRIALKTNYTFSGEYKLDERKRVVFLVGKYGTEIQANPTQWESYKEFQGVLETFFDKTKDLKIMKLHCFTDVSFPLNFVNKNTQIKWKRKSKSFANESIESTRSRGRLSEVCYTFTHGNVRTQSFCLYDSSSKHSYPSPMSRIERRDNVHATVPIKYFGDIHKLLNEPIFSSVEFKPRFKIFKNEDSTLDSIFKKARSTIGFNIARGVLRAEADDKFKAESYLRKMSRSRLKIPNFDIESQFKEHLLLWLKKEVAGE